MSMSKIVALIALSICAPSEAGIMYLSFPEFEEGLKTEIKKSIGPYGTSEVTDALADAYVRSMIEKSLQATGAIPVQSTSGGDALKMQDIIAMVQNVDLNADEYAVFFRNLPKVPLYNDVAERTALTALGGSIGGGFLSLNNVTGGIDAVDPTLKRETLKVKWYGGRYTTNMSVNALRTLGLNVDPMTGNAHRLSMQARLEMLYQHLNFHAWHGDSSKNVNEWDGVIKQIRDASSTARPTRYNLAGNAMTPDHIPVVQQMLFDNGSGNWNQMWWPARVLSSLKQQMIPTNRTAPGQMLTLGNPLDAYLVEQFGGDPQRASFKRDYWLGMGSLMLELSTAETGAPTKPTTVAVTAQTAAASNVWSTYLASGTYFYSVEAVGLKGRSDLRAGDVSGERLGGFGPALRACETRSGSKAIP